ncbi:hypothetical protein DM02DRAFT_112951 [Periconia macrospinosa]|uniref:Uncharacterized protein n=1 Tax=Periconia macrospinosa TaxID=97972 RepID=A0A2V1E572_9PLEO|nr:hypothetical protein DM02DRAFT_112951 [Periconia macrospinosa]
MYLGTYLTPCSTCLSMPSLFGHYQFRIQPLLPHSFTLHATKALFNIAMITAVSITRYTDTSIHTSHTWNYVISDYACNPLPCLPLHTYKYIQLQGWPASSHRACAFSVQFSSFREGQRKTPIWSRMHRSPLACSSPVRSSLVFQSACYTDILQLGTHWYGPSLEPSFCSFGLAARPSRLTQRIQLLR